MRPTSVLRGPETVRAGRPVSFVALAGNHKVGRHSLVLRLGSHHLLVDPGLSSGEKINFNGGRHGGNVDVMLLTHAHLDHVGALPAAIKRYPNARVYATPETKALCLQMVRRKTSLSEHEIRYLEDKIQSLVYRREMEVGRGIRFHFIPAGHILGSASIVVTSPEGNFLLTGDYSNEPRGVIPQFISPDCDFRAVISETSFVGMEATAFRRSFRRLVEKIGRAAEQHKPIVIATDPLGVLQEAAMLLPPLQAKGLLPEFTYAIDPNLWESFLTYRHYYRGLEQQPGQDHYLFTLAQSARPPVIENGLPYCYLVGPGNLNDNFPKTVVQDILRAGGLLFAEDRYSLDLIARRTSWDNGGEAVVDQIRQFDFGNHISEVALRWTIRNQQPGTAVLIHGTAADIARFVRTFPRPSQRFVVPRVGEEIAI